jgi:hypothetical protein
MQNISGYIIYLQSTQIDDNISHFHGNPYSCKSFDLSILQ